MKILKEGDTNRLGNIRHFECETCGCVFEACRAEYRQESDFRNGHYYICKCPMCRENVIVYPEDEAKWK